MNAPRAILSMAVTVAVVGTLAACSSPRSVDAFCDTLAEHKATYLASMEAATQSGGLEGLLGAAGAIGDLAIMWDELAKVAPADIQSDAESVRDAWKQQEEAAAEGDFGGALVTALLNSGSMSRMDAYIRSNCDGDYSVQAGDAPEAEQEEPSAPPVEPVNAIGLEDSWQDRDGYSYAINVQDFATTVVTDVANAKPGEVNVTFSLEVTASLSNTTEARNAPSPRGAVILAPIWSAASPICQLGVGDDAWSSNVPTLEGNFCSIAGDGMDFQVPGNQIMDGQTVEVLAGGGRSYALPEAEADSLIALLEAPEGWVLARDVGGDLLTDCLMRSGGYYVSVATINTECTCGVGTNCIS